MILNVTTGTGFKGILSYVEKQEKKELRPEQKPEILQEQNIYGSAQEKAQQMRFVADNNSFSSRPVLHVSVSLQENEKLNNQKRDEVLNDIIKELGATPENNQYQIVKHNDTDLEHYHIVINKVGFDGSNINTSYIQNKCHVIADKLEQKHELERVNGRKIVYDPSNEKGYRYTSQEERKANEQKKRASKARDKSQSVEDKKNHIKSNLSLALEDKSITTPEALSKALAEKNIETRYNTNKNGISGVSFRYQEVSVKGSEIQYKANYVATKLEQNKAIQIQSTTIAPKAEPIQKPIEKPMQNDDREFTREYNQRIENVVNAHNTAYDKGEKPDTKAIFEENGFKKENDMFVYSNDDHRKEISGASFEQHSKLVQDIEIKQKRIDDEYKKTQEQIPEKVPLFIGKAEAIKRNEALKAKQKSPKIVMQKPRLRSQDFTIQSRTKLLQDRKAQEAKLQKEKEERQVKQNNQKSKGRGI